jgi:hypothetical protein
MRGSNYTIMPMQILLGSWKQIYLLFTRVEDLLTLQVWDLIVKEDPRAYLQKTLASGIRSPNLHVLHMKSSFLLGHCLEGPPFLDW